MDITPQVSAHVDLLGEHVTYARRALAGYGGDTDAARAALASEASERIGLIVKSMEIGPTRALLAQALAMLDVARGAL